ncbi:T9SS type A sorting domain-containing protein [Longimonas halophila]|nr:T9SS type A sorting domain-containing protein [Longimonas halophila]
MAQIPAQPINQPCTTCEPTAMHEADLDGDGAPDVLSASKFDEKLAWYENTGSGYGEQQVIDDALPLDADFNSQPMYAADVDGDGDLDVVAAPSAEERAVWYENQIGESGSDADGFGPAQTITTAHGKVYAVAAAELSGDGKADVVLGTSDSGIIWFESQIGEGGNDFGTATTIASLSEATDPTAIVMADVSGNANPDVIYAALGQIAWHENTGGSFGSQTSIATPLEVGGIAAGDVDDDGDLDVAASADGDVVWYENSGGAFGSQTAIQSFGFGAAAQTVAVADADGDGKEDVFAGIQNTSAGDDRIVWHESQVGEAGADSDGFGSEQVITTSLLTPRDLATANVDGGSDLELLSATESDDRIAWYENTGSGYGPPQPVNIWPDVLLPQSVVATDLNADMATDVLVASRDDNKVSWYENTDGSGAFSSQNVIANNARSPEVALAADLNNDDKPDAVVASGGRSATGRITWYENQVGESGADADGFGAVQVIDAPNEVSLLEAVDLDGDGDLDLVAAYGSFSFTLVWYENQISDGSGFGAAQTIASNVSNLTALEVADLNGGAPDVVIGYGTDPFTLAWFENTDGAGSFSSENEIDSDVGGELSDINASPVDGDADQDLVLASRGFNFDGLAWYENQIGAGSGFGAQSEITTAIESPQAVHTADVNGDSQPDLLSASRGDDTVAWFENTGGAFTAQQVITTSDKGRFVQGAQDVFAADINGDSQTDVLSVSTGREEIAWFENTEGVLPVELTRFDAQLNQNEVQLSWATASETNNARFDVQRRTTGADGARSWTTTGRIEGAGTTETPQSYHFVDADVPSTADTLRYRLRQVDTNGHVTLSEAETIVRTVDALHIREGYPNPAHDRVTVPYASPNAQQVTVSVYDILGRQVRSAPREMAAGRSTMQVDVSRLSSGTYFLRVESDEMVETQRITVVR